MRRGTFFDDFPATSILLLLIGAFYGLEAVFTMKVNQDSFLKSAMEIDGKVLVSLGANSWLRLKEGEVWRLVSHAFLHVNLVHILMNGWVLVDLGRLCEPLLGTWRFTAVYLASAVGGGLGTAAYAALTGGPGVSAGASGALSGLIGLLLAFSLRHRDRELRDQMVRWIIYIVLFTVLISNVDHAAHAGGFLVGAAFGWFTPRYVSSRSARLWKIPAWAASALAAAALGLALWHHFHSGSV